MIKPEKNKEWGFTILELIIYILLFSIVGILGTSVFNFALKAKTSVGRLNEVQLSIQRVMEQIIDRVHSSVTINGASSTLSLKMSDAAKDPTVFALSGNAVTIQEGTSAAAVITPSTTLVTVLTFTKIDNPTPATSSVQIKITAGYNDSGSVDPANTYSLQTTALPL